MDDISLLKKRIEQISTSDLINKNINSGEFKAWYAEVLRILDRLFKTNSREYKDFSSIQFSNPTAIFSEYAYRGGIQQAKMTLESYVEQLESSVHERKPLPTQIFMSHTKRDEDFCNRLDTIAARVPIKVFRSEFEDIKPPSWITIKNEINNSIALFLMVGKELVNAQEESDSSTIESEKWKYTQNWISYEVGLACHKGIDVWVICDGIQINFPVPYLNNYEIYGIHENSRKMYREVLENYSKGFIYPTPSEHTISCSRNNCKAVYNLHSIIPKEDFILCPTCLHTISFKDGWLVPK